MKTAVLLQTLGILLMSGGLALLAIWLGVTVLGAALVLVGIANELEARSDGSGQSAKE